MRQPNFDYRIQMEETRAKASADAKKRHAKWLNLMKTKNTLIATKGDIEDFKTKVDNLTRKSIAPNFQVS